MKANDAISDAPLRHFRSRFDDRACDFVAQNLWRLNEIVTRAFGETWATREARTTSMRMAAYGLAVQRVAEATVTRGLYP